MTLLLILIALPVGYLTGQAMTLRRIRKAQRMQMSLYRTHLAISRMHD